jgi:hypothetical protein
MTAGWKEKETLVQNIDLSVTSPIAAAAAMVTPATPDLD